MKAVFIGSNTLVSDLKRELAQMVKDLGQTTLEEAKSKTPVKSGNARSKWTKTQSKDTFEVANRVPYIERLEAGASRQAPKGIIGPTLTAIKGKTK
ncbi:Bacteriophage HK97-gp10, putative tail-component [uncultured Caudovirales phage]|uniref:Bacteriophage HK97-gp10, putative tail-component n=1 Tax=uncultured Caudovirales phage TaxID=2100421 RepID=A0A6J7X1U3_9CAUD|nr:Bacteriophage HK97-gp10, putative tail-component [uncultured Caudovirales phage]